MHNHNLFSLKSAALAITASLPLVLTNCVDEDFGYSAQEIAYKNNFEKTYGTIPEDKSWDLSSWANWQEIKPYEGTRAINDGHATKGKLVENTHFSVGGNWYKVPLGLLSWLDNQLVEGNDNRYLGSSFVLKVPNNDFAIIPIYQGNSAIASELELKINDYDITKIWTKSQNIQGDLGSGYKECGFFDGYPTYDAVTKAAVQVADNTKDGEYDFKDAEGKKYVYKPSPTMHPASTILDVAVQAKPIIFHKNQIQTTTGLEYMYLSLRNIAKAPVPKGKRGHFDHDANGNEHWVVDQYVLENNEIVTSMWDQNNVWTTIGDRLTSINSNGYMLALNVPWDRRPSADALAALLPGYDRTTKGAPQALIIGCEDANGGSSDHDVNDIVFLIVGYPDIPTVVPTTEVIKKRYMCEDLGATDDFDFNDVVVDVTQTQEYQLEIKPDGANKDGFFNNKVDAGALGQVEITNITPVEGSKVQTAKISHVCGTLPIQVQVGNYLFPWITDPTDLLKTRTELRAGGWKYNGSSWVTSEVNTPTRAAYDVKEEGWNPNEERVITGWDPRQNNIRVYVQWPEKWGTPKSENNNQQGGSLLEDHNWAASNPYTGNGKKDFIDFIQGDRRVESVTFPKPGTVPYIIAMDPDVPWMKERKDILHSWLTNGEWETSDQYYKDNVAGPGSGAYYENDPDRAIIWTGKVGGEAYVTGVTCAKGSSEQLGAAEAIESGYNTINIYTQPFNDLNMRGYVGLSYIDSEDSWQTLTVNDAEGYLDDADVMVGSDKTTKWHCANIRLTQEQMNAIKNNGFVVQSRTNALVIREINFTKTEGFTVQLTDPVLDAANHNSVMGSITAADRRRDRSLSETGGRIPFVKASYSTGETCKLTAVPSTGYAFVKWSDNNTDNPRSVSSDLGPITAVFEFREPTATIDLDKNKFHRWSSYQADAHISSPSTWSYSENTPFGDTNVSGENYADLTGSDVLVVKCDAGVNLRLVFNRQSLDNNGADFFSFVTDSDKDYTVLHNDGNGQKTILINLAAIRAAKGYVHLNKMEKRGEGNITSMKLDQYDSSAETAFTTFKNNWDAADGGIALTKEMFYEWTEVANDARVRGEGGRTSHVIKVNEKAGEEVKGNVYCQTVLGSTYNNEREYANLTNATWLLVKTDAYSDAPRFWFNGKTLDFLGTDTRFCRIYKGTYGGNHEYLVDLAAVRTASGGKSLLNAITTANGNTSAKVSVVKVSGYSCANATAWDAAMTTVNGIQSWPVEFKSTVDAAGNHPTSPDYTVEGGWPWGNATHNDAYVDLSSANWMRITLPTDNAARKDVRLSFNAVDNDHRLLLDKSSEYVFPNGKYWYVNLAKIKEAAGKVEFHAIGGPAYGQNAKIERIEFDQYTAPTPATLYSVHVVCRLGNSGNEDNTSFGYPTFTVTSGSIYTDNAGVKNLVSGGTISTVNTVYATENAVIQITAPTPTNLDYAFEKWSNGTTTASRQITVTDNSTPYAQYKYSIKGETRLLAENDDQQGWTTTLSASNYNVSLLEAYNGTAGSNGYGDPNVSYSNYADLSSNTVLKLVLKKSETKTIPEFTFNRPEGGDAFKVSEEINSDYLYVNRSLESSNDITIYYVNLKAIQSRDNHVYLHCIKPKWSSDGKKIYLYEPPKAKNKAL